MGRPAISDKKMALLKFEYETSKDKLKDIAKKHGITHATLIKYSKQEGWVRCDLRPKVDLAVEKKATERLIEKEANMLFEYTDEYIQNIKRLDMVHRLNLKAYTNQLADKNNVMDYKSALKFKTVQDFLHKSAQTFLLNFQGYRLAMGFDKKEVMQGPQYVFPKLTLEEAKNAKEAFDRDF